MHIDPEKPGRLFLFIDETGDPGHPDSQDASTFYQLNIVAATRKDAGKILQQVSSFRYFVDAHKELDVYDRQEEKICQLLEICSSFPGTRLACFYLDKHAYVGPYLQKIGKERFDWDPSKFRNFIIRKSLEQLFSEILPTDHETLRLKGFEVEIVFDRFLLTDEAEQQLRNYLRSNYRLPTLLHIVQVDSVYSDPIQLADMVGKLVKRKIFDNAHRCDLGFISQYSLENPKSIEKRKGP